jgi:hypothetical protein
MSSQESRVDVAPAKRSSRIWEWFWRGEALREAREAQNAERPQLLRERRARNATEVASWALNPSGPWLSGDTRHIACGLFVESIAWSLRRASVSSGAEAVAAPAGEAKGSATAGERPPTSDELEKLIATHQALLLAAAKDRERLNRVSKHLLARDFEATTFPADELETAARELRQVAEGMLRLAGQSSAALDLVIVQRLYRMGALALLLLAAVWAVGVVWRRLELRADLAAGKPWVASSVYEPGCRSPARHCAPDKGYFFHTQEEMNPWVEIDLLKNERFSAVSVVNRQDCCGERSVPLLVEVSTDHQTWRELARRRDTFQHWKASFAPVSARWVRLRVARQSLLHLNDVHVLK